ncbi:MAG: hypothetical protein KGK03_02890 [Candidatus Omnitrophica bacterium]|nr:hypothetical protein [Candidatus Omnitrophota bacterium]MDE2221998.1 hypothetical protein [Candidatus Omnitrophota bacterium]
MFIWDFNVIVALSLGLALTVVLAAWVFYTLKRRRPAVLSEQEFFKQCGFCGFLYFDYSKKSPGTCPRCGSYQDR